MQWNNRCSSAVFYGIYLFKEPATTEIYTYGHTLSLHDALPIFGHIVVTLPFAFGPVFAAMNRYDPALDEAGMSLGAKPGYVFRHITVPVLRPGIAAGFLFAFIMSFDEVTVTMFLKGPLFTTLPVQIFSEVQEGSAQIGRAHV